MAAPESMLADLPVLILDAQATTSASRGGQLVELGWALVPPGGELGPGAAGVSARLVAPAGEASMPRAVQRLTGVSNADWRRGSNAVAVWGALLDAAASDGVSRAPVVIHFACFEEPFLHALQERHGPAGPFPFELLCTHAIARRLLPELPRRTLRALAGYFGAAVPPLRRSGDHVVATALVWRHLIALLAEREGIVSLADLRGWVARPARRAPRRFALAREARRALPEGPGVYRFLRAGGAVLYVGKAASLRARVRSHFHARAAHERSLEMLTQVRQVACAETATAVEAALLESDEIKRLAPPYNVALMATGRALCFATAELDHVQPEPDANHAVGPLASSMTIEALQALRAALADPSRTTATMRARALGVEPPWVPVPECFAAGLARFAAERGRLEHVRDVARLGRKLWALRCEGDELDGESEAQAAGGFRRRDEPGAGPTGAPSETDLLRPRTPDGHSKGRLSAWDAERVVEALERTVARAAHAVRRAGWLLRLSECSLAWSEPGRAERRLLVIAGGHVVCRAYIGVDGPLPTPDGHVHGRQERQRGFDLATFDRLRVLTTELRGLALHSARLELRLGPHVLLSRRRVQRVLQWI